MILSTVRSQPLNKIKNKYIVQADYTWKRENLGFITDKHQINVGITRSKYGLVILGKQLSFDFMEQIQLALFVNELEGNMSISNSVFCLYCKCLHFGWRLLPFFGK